VVFARVNVARLSHVALSETVPPAVAAKATANERA
jgi:hypothetical protein